ncbi:MAG: hypothetical protein WA979_01400 [Pacificimonas sp.]
MLKIISTFAISAALATSAAAQGERTCISPVESEAVIGNLLPAIMSQSARHCAQQLGEGAFLAREGERLAADLTPHSRASWPVAKSVMEKIGGTALPDNEAILEAGRAIIAGGIANGLDAPACDTVSRLTEQLAPLPAENFTGVFALFLELGIAENASVPFKVCRAEG